MKTIKKIARLSTKHCALSTDLQLDFCWKESVVNLFINICFFLSQVNILKMFYTRSVVNFHNKDAFTCLSRLEKLSCNLILNIFLVWLYMEESADVNGRILETRDFSYPKNKFSPRYLHKIKSYKRLIHYVY